ncbi:MAG: hypothetical protein JWQ90_4933 [Hydrocarboniphaga sp.]|uniref:hypothetical protein n=1 Tax=Hydrocarboniphaga sp. TaxID=2033016 RepID=UPI0026131574|nr:hypothetical protein [Hydrocarboniphaga sp.]MDB5972483.1 hypothetical protein [Hydrocarboniphaga sp.]
MKIVATLILIASTTPALAGVPMDSFNSANAGLLPALATERSEESASLQGGPAQALVLMARRSRKSVAAPLSPAAEPVPETRK